MSQYIVYCLDMKTHNVDIVDILSDEKSAKICQNSHAFNLLGENLRLCVKNNIIQIFEINIKIQKGWIKNLLEEEKRIIYEIGIVTFGKNPIQPMKIRQDFFEPPKKIQPPPPPPPPSSQKNKKEPNWNDIMNELRKRRSTIH